MMVISTTGGGDGLFAAGNLGLDFVNAGGNGRDRLDVLRTAPELRLWLASSGVGIQGYPTDSPSATPDARVLLTEARRLRNDLEGLMTAFSAGQKLPEPALHNVNRTLVLSRVRTSLETVNGRLRLNHAQAADSILAPLVPIALAAAELLVSADPARVRRCASDRCGLWFLDMSKNGRRKWCSMATCGNRAKASRHYKKRAAS